MWFVVEVVIFLCLNIINCICVVLEYCIVINKFLKIDSKKMKIEGEK